MAWFDDLNSAATTSENKAVIRWLQLSVRSFLWGCYFFNSWLDLWMPAVWVICLWPSGVPLTLFIAHLTNIFPFQPVFKPAEATTIGRTQSHEAEISNTFSSFLLKLGFPTIWNWHVWQAPEARTMNFCCFHFREPIRKIVFGLFYFMATTASLDGVYNRGCVLMLSSVWMAYLCQPNHFTPNQSLCS